MCFCWLKIFFTSYFCPFYPQRSTLLHSGTTEVFILAIHVKLITVYTFQEVFYICSWPSKCFSILWTKKTTSSYVADIFYICLYFNLFNFFYISIYLLLRKIDPEFEWLHARAFIKKLVQPCRDFAIWKMEKIISLCRDSALRGRRIPADKIVLLRQDGSILTSLQNLQVL